MLLRDDVELVEAHLLQLGLIVGEQLLGVLSLEGLESWPYTTTLQERQETQWSWLPMPTLQVRAYHDARMAEVIAAEKSRMLLGRPAADGGASKAPRPLPWMSSPTSNSRKNATLV